MTGSTKGTKDVSPPGKCPLRAAGRPRSEASHAAILKAGYRLLVNASVQSISTQQIAAEAGVSTATLYRWWPTKEAVLLDGYLHMHADDALLRTNGSPLKRLREHARNMGQLFEGEDGMVTVRLLMAIQEDEALRQAFITRLYRPKMELCLAVAKEAQAKGELPPGANIRLFLDTLFGLLITRLLIRQEHVDNAFIDQVFDFAVAGAKHSVESKAPKRAAP